MLQTTGSQLGGKYGSCSETYSSFVVAPCFTFTVNMEEKGNEENFSK